MFTLVTYDLGAYYYTLLHALNKPGQMFLNSSLSFYICVRMYNQQANL